MIDALRPWIGLTFGAWLIWLGWLWASRPQAFVGAGLVPATVPRTIRALGIFGIMIGAATLLTNLSTIVSE